MDVFFTIRSAPLDELRAQIDWIDGVGGAGVMVPDHLFSGGPGQSRAEARRGADPLVLLSAVAAMSSRLKLGTSVSNVGFLHPALVLRQFVQLAVLVGGERVLAGLGAGWNREEFEALGMPMPGFAKRMDRLEEAAGLARALFDDGLANLEGSQVIARDLPMAPVPDSPPRLLLGGGSDRLLEIAGRYADALDLNGTSQAGALRGSNLPQADQQRRLSTTVHGLEGSVKRVAEVAQAAGRPADAVRMSVLVNHVIFCGEQERITEGERISAAAGLPTSPLDDCPYVLLGEPERMIDTLRDRQARLGLRAMILMSTTPRPTAERLLREVVAHLD